MSRFKPRTPKWRKFATAEEIELVDGCEALIEHHKNDLARARRLKADTINAANARATKQEQANG